MEITLKDTYEMMLSPDHKERFRAEYYQLAIRIDGLAEMLRKYKNDELNFTPTCSFDLLNGQLKSMDLYMSYLEDRAIVENIEL